jgi:hypothetical protein
VDIRGAPAPSATGIVRVEPTNAALVGTRAARNGTRDRGAKEAAVAASERLLTAKRVREEKALAVANAAARISAPAWVLKRGRFHPRFIARWKGDSNLVSRGASLSSRMFRPQLL